jgi:hypothetical protein
VVEVEAETTVEIADEDWVEWMRRWGAVARGMRDQRTWERLYGVEWSEEKITRRRSVRRVSQR